MLQCDTVDPVIFKRNLNCYTAKLHGPGLIWGNWYNSVKHSIDIPFQILTEKGCMYNEKLLALHMNRCVSCTNRSKI